ncbi:MULTISPECIES: DNA polymerase thumb domain-containing protein [Bacillaceae]|uniref:UV damage repair protein UvrX n=1 Tax=Evansella alkalicola TaxID=745819 RepID=A0ABS6JZN7_9BACI|nr:MULTISPECIES: UV damage repair protein UvrX [Bacillaceae]MBU9724056.1 UV damage repair protein UvrX [Bacillus alkalicola]
MDVMYESLPKRTIFCIDMKSFYASCAAVALGLDPLTCHLAVVGDTNRDGSVILAATPALKRDFGLKTGNRLFEVPKDSRIRLVNATMATYLNVSVQVTDLFHKYVPMEAIHTYSVDESFVDIRGTERLWGNEWELARRIQKDLLKQFGLTCAIGIGSNMLLAKVCLDLEAKNQPGGIAKWTYDDVEEKLWPITPLQKMWGIGSRIEKRLHQMGIFTVGQLAKFPLNKLEKKFGIMGNQLYYHARGVDLSELGAPILSGQISYGKSQILMRDYDDPVQVKRVILEMCEEVAARARKEERAGQTISLGIGYSKEVGHSGFHRQITVAEPTNITMELYNACLRLFDRNYDGSIVRRVSVALANICEDTSMQLNLFDTTRPKQRALGYVMDEIRRKHGANALLRGISYTEGGTARHRNTLVGGHKS